MFTCLNIFSCNENSMKELRMEEITQYNQKRCQEDILSLELLLAKCAGYGNFSPKLTCKS